MPANRFNGFTEYGIGIGLRIPHYQHILEKKPVVDWFEIISENYMIDGGRPLAILDQILEQYKVVQHGVSMYFGSTSTAEPGAPEAVEAAGAAHGERRGSPTICAGAAWTGATPTTCCRCPIRGRRSRLRRQTFAWCRTFVEVPVVLENVSSYAEFHDSEMTEWEFLTEVVERADCGILLDVNNIYVSSINHEFDPAEYVDYIPAERVAQMHIAGHSRYERFLLDTHDHPVIDPVWKLYERALGRTGPTATLLEWDDRIPPFEEVHNEALKAKKYLDAVTAAASPRDGQLRRERSHDRPARIPTHDGAGGDAAPEHAR